MSYRSTSRLIWLRPDVRIVKPIVFVPVVRKEPDVRAGMRRMRQAAEDSGSGGFSLNSCRPGSARNGTPGTHESQGSHSPTQTCLLLTGGSSHNTEVVRPSSGYEEFPLMTGRPVRLPVLL